MDTKTILLLGGYGNTGNSLARLLLQESNLRLVIAGRNLEKAENLSRELNEIFPAKRVRGAVADASNPESLRTVFQEVSMVIVASSTTCFTRQVATAALHAGIDYLDIQYSPEKITILHSLEEEIRKSGACFITDGGFHPGLPGFMVRYISQYFDMLETAKVGSVIKQDWRNLQVGEAAVNELVELINDFEMQLYKGGKWKKASMLSTADFIHMDFGGEFKKMLCAPMLLEEMRKLPEIYPTLMDTGFYVGGFNWFVDWVVMPLAMLAVKLSPHLAIQPMGRWMHWGLNTFSKPPFGLALRIEATGKKKSLPGRMAATLSHPDGYAFTAIPVAACLLQYLDGSIHQPGLWWQALVVEPNRFMADMERMGIKLSMEEWSET